MTSSSIACYERHHAYAKLGRPAPDGISPTPIPALAVHGAAGARPNSIKSTPMAAIVSAQQMRRQGDPPRKSRLQPGTPRQSPRRTSTNRKRARKSSARRACHQSGTHR